MPGVPSLTPSSTRSQSTGFTLLPSISSRAWPFPGFGTFTVEDTTVYGRSFINLRPDYGSTWRGEFVIRNCVFVPACGRPVSSSLIGGSYSGQHDFGYTCYMPERITIDTLHIDDTQHPDGYEGPAIFANFNPRFTDGSYVEKYPYVKTREVILKEVRQPGGTIPYHYLRPCL